MAFPSKKAPCGTVTIQLEGAFGFETAARTLARVTELTCDQIVIDLSRTRDISEVALAFLAGGLAELPQSRVSLLGLRAEHARLLGKLGARRFVP